MTHGSALPAEARSPRPEARVVTETTLSLPLYTRGKVRDVYSAGDHLLIVATDRVSAFDHVLPTPIPDKGRVLTQLSAFWFQQTQDIVPNHLVSSYFDHITDRLPQLRGLAGALAGRTMLVRMCRRFDVECVVRGYITGSAWDEYRRTGSVPGVPLPPALRNGDALPEPVFTPAIKAARGHDEHISFGQMAGLVGVEAAQALRDTSVALFRRAAAHAQSVGLILADTKFEFGMHDGTITLIDEALTPDSSRYWDAAQYPGARVAFDKQYLRDYLNEIGWNHEPPAPALPPEVVEATRQRYLETYRRLTGGAVAR